ncbi:hypothetical protein AYX14_00794 [Cryptococcus neoformans]|nr:hypothetical protein AYX14_00794 [Cryptococcus neoformans var. grubii]
MPVLIPQLGPPKDANPVAAATTQLLEQVRALTEWYANGDSSPSSFIDFAGYRQLQEWAKNPEALNVIDKILQTRLGFSSLIIRRHSSSSNLCQRISLPLTLPYSNHSLNPLRF